MRALRRKPLTIALAVIAVAAVLIVLAFDRPRAAPPVAGMVRQTEYRIAPEITGRLTAIAVQSGQQVHKGDLLATLDNPELAASVGEAKAALAAARAERDRVYSGMRAEEVAILAKSVLTAEANLTLARQEIGRTTALAARDFASRQELDDRTAALAKSEADLALKRAQHAAGAAGPTAEERTLTDARVALAEATAADLQAKLDKTRLIAPADGVVGVIVGERGEIVPVGKPVLVLAAGKPWFAFTLREDALGRLTVGSDVELTAATGQRFAARVTELRPLGEFATWRAARAVGDHDLNSFRLRLDPLTAVDGLRPGMTVWLARAANDKADR
jgi:multidrug resistance efflux pump